MKNKFPNITEIIKLLEGIIPPPLDETPKHKLLNYENWNKADDAFIDWQNTRTDFTSLDYEKDNIFSDNSPKVFIVGDRHGGMRPAEEILEINFLSPEIGARAKEENRKFLSFHEGIGMPNPISNMAMKLLNSTDEEILNTLKNSLIKDDLSFWKEFIDRNPLIKKGGATYINSNKDEILNKALTHVVNMSSFYTEAHSNDGKTYTISPSFSEMDIASILTDRENGAKIIGLPYNLPEINICDFTKDGNIIIEGFFENHPDKMALIPYKIENGKVVIDIKSAYPISYEEEASTYIKHSNQTWGNHIASEALNPENIINGKAPYIKVKIGSKHLYTDHSSKKLTVGVDEFLENKGIKNQSFTAFLFDNIEKTSVETGFSSNWFVKIPIQR